jgi:ADP-ribose pyrophosphatase
MKTFKTLARRTILPHGKFLTVEEHTIEAPNGQVIDDWPWVITPDYINLMVETADGRWLLLRQTKYAVSEPHLAPVGGYLEPGEDPLETARRELLEETGYEAPEWISLGSYGVDASRGVAVGHLFLARGARRIAPPDDGDLEEIELVLLSRREVEALLDEGGFRLLPWALTAALALRRSG